MRVKIYRDLSMQVRTIRKLLNNTKYTVTNEGEYLAIGGPYIHNIIQVDVDTLKVHAGSYRTREGLNKDKEELGFIWDKLQELVDKGEMRSLLDGQDVIENPITLFTVVDGELVECITEDDEDYPKVDQSGVTVYANTHFKTMEEAIQYGIRENIAAVRRTKGSMHSIQKDLNAMHDRYSKYLSHAVSLKATLKRMQREGEGA
jgi:hypothetical protein